jgi:HSP90 family molecular chaperone
LKFISASISLCRRWNQESQCWENNKSLALQREFVKKFYKRCSHSFERPSMVDRFDSS